MIPVNRGENYWRLTYRILVCSGSRPWATTSGIDSFNKGTYTSFLVTSKLAHLECFSSCWFRLSDDFRVLSDVTCVTYWSTRTWRNVIGRVVCCDSLRIVLTNSSVCTRVRSMVEWSLQSLGGCLWRPQLPLHRFLCSYRLFLAIDETLLVFMSVLIITCDDSLNVGWVSWVIAALHNHLICSKWGIWLYQASSFELFWVMRKSIVLLIRHFSFILILSFLPSLSYS